MHLGFLELAIILVVILLVLGPKQIPKLTNTVKNSINEFKKGAENESSESTENATEVKG